MSISGVEIECVDSVKILGIEIDRGLTFAKHAERVFEQVKKEPMDYLR